MSFRRVVSALLLIAYLPACTSFQATSQPLSELTAPPKPAEKVRITTSDGKQRDVDAPRVVNDTLYGSAWETGPSGKPGAVAVALPLSEVRTVEVRKSDGTNTAILIGGIVLIFVVGAVAWSNSDWLDLSGASLE